MATIDNASLVDRRNTIFVPLKFRARVRVAGDLDPVFFQVEATHVGGYTNNAVLPR